MMSLPAPIGLLKIWHALKVNKGVETLTICALSGNYLWSYDYTHPHDYTPT